MKKQLSTAVQVMVDQSCVITVYRCRGVIEGGQQVSPDVSDFRCVLFQAVYDIPDMLPVDFKQAVLYDFPWVVLAAYAYPAFVSVTHQT